MAAIVGQQTSFENESSLPQLVDATVRHWVLTQKYVKLMAQPLFITAMVGSGVGNTRIYDEFDTETYAADKMEGANASKAKVGVGYQVTMTAKTIAKTIDITFELRNDQKYLEISNYLESLNNFCNNRIDLDLTHRLTFGTSTSYVDRDGYTVATTTGDGLALYSTAHTLAFSSTTYSNRLTGDPAFSEGSFEAAKILAATNLYSNFGEKRNMEFNTIFCADYQPTIRAIKQLLESSADVDAVQSGITNIYQSSMTLVVLPQLATTAFGATDTTKQRWWGIASTGKGMDGWQAYYGVWRAPEMRTPAPGNNGENIQNLNWTFLTFARYGICTPTPKGIVASCPTS